MAEEIEYGKQIIVIFEPFIWSLISDKLNRKTIETHIDNLWLLGGELIRLINQDQNNLDEEPLNLLLENIGNGVKGHTAGISRLRMK